MRVLVPSYKQLFKNLERCIPMENARLTLAEKILYSHLAEPLDKVPVRGSSYLKLNPGSQCRVLLLYKDASAQTAILQFMLSSKKSTSVPSSIHCDHLIEAKLGASTDLQSSLITNKEIFDFLESASKKYGIDFWRPGSGIIHQIVLENYAAPGTLLLGTDSHTPNGGGLGMLAIGVGGADAVDAMTGIPWELKAPKILGVELTGKLSGWATPKDVILMLAGLLTVQGGTNHIIEYFGPGCETLSATGMATICNMGAEVGATTSVFPFSQNMARYLNYTNRNLIAKAADSAASAGFLKRDKGAEYDKVIKIDLSKIEPFINGPFSPDVAWPISKFKDAIKENGWKDQVSASLIGSCTNSSYQDMSNASDIADQAKSKGLNVKTSFFITPGSEQIRATIERDGITEKLESVGGKVLANACGPCIGQWKRLDHNPAQESSILTSFNRNFKGRNDGSVKTMNFLASPEIVTAMAFAGKLSFNPCSDSLIDSNGQKFMLTPPQASDLPGEGFVAGRREFSFPETKDYDPSVEIAIPETSTRLQELKPFDGWDGQEFRDLCVLVKVAGKCTTDHISAAGPWLKYKGHLENLSQNTLIGATNAYNSKVNLVYNQISGNYDTIPSTAFEYKRNGIPWIIVADWNYGEGSAREHAALQPRYLGCKIVISRSFARIHETNLKKQGILPLVFANPNDYDLITENARIETVGVQNLAPNSKVQIRFGDTSIELRHTMSHDQIKWFKAGSALNSIKQ